MMNDDEARWREEFEAAGEVEVQRKVNSQYFRKTPEKGSFAQRWLDEKATARLSREIGLFSYAKRTYWAALVAVLVGILGIVVTWLH
jgi:hypothetical protein